jgi:hypothetical protein
MQRKINKRSDAEVIVVVKEEKDLRWDRTCQICIMRILNKDFTKEERDDVLETIENASVDVIDVLSKLATIRGLMLIYARNEN